MKLSRRNKIVLAAVLLAVVVAVPVAWAVFSLVAHFPVTVTVVPTGVTHAIMTSVTMDNVECPITGNGTTATCPVYAGEMFVGESIPLSITVQDTGTIAAQVVVTPTSDNVGVATVTASPTNPTSIPQGGSATFSFTVAAHAAGTANVQVTISG